MAVQTIFSITHDLEVSGAVGSADIGKGGLLMPAGQPLKQIHAMINFLEQLGSGARMGSLLAYVNSTAVAVATGTVQCISVANADTCTVAGQAFTAVAGGTPTSVQFDQSGTDLQTAVNLAAAITAHATVGTYVKAAASNDGANAVVTITSLIDGPIGNLISLATSNSTRLPKSATFLAGGVGNNDGAQATGSVTCATVLAGATVTVAGTVFTAVNGGTPTSVQFDMSGTDSATATNLAAALAAHATVGGYVYAKAFGAVVIIIARTSGTIGNLISLATSDNTSLAKSGTVLANGSGNNTRTTTRYKYGVT